MKRKLTAILLSLAMLLVYAPIGVFAEAGDTAGQDDLLKVVAQVLSDTSVKLTWTPANGYKPTEDVMFTINNGEEDLTGELSAVPEDNEEGYEYSPEEGYSFVVEGLEAETEYELEVVSSDLVEEKTPSGKVQFTTEAAEAEEEEEAEEPKLLAAGEGEKAPMLTAEPEEGELADIPNLEVKPTGNKSTKNYLQLTWDAVEGAEKYIICWSGDSFEKKWETQNLHFKKTISTAGKSYTFHVVAVDAEGNPVSLETECSGIVPKIAVARKTGTTTATTTTLVVTIPAGHAGTYKLISVCGTDKTIKKVINNDGTKQTLTIKVSKLLSAKAYKFYVINADTGVVSNTRAVNTTLLNVTGFTATSSADAVILKWKRVPRATGYTITWKGGGRTGTIKVAKGTTTTYLDNFGTNYSLLHPYATSYTYSIKATKKGFLASRKAASVTSDVIRTMLLSITFGTSRTLTSHTGGSVSAYFAKGTTVTATGYTNGKYIFYYNGRQYQVLRASISSASVKQLNTSKTYTATEATSYVNRMGLSSSTSYLIWVNTYTQKEYVFKGSKGHWTLVQGPWLIASGKPSSPTSTGMTKIVDRMVSNGAPYWNVTYWFSLHGNAKVWGALGYPKSGACVRNTNEHAKWIFYNTPMYTAVYVF